MRSPKLNFAQKRFWWMCGCYSGFACRRLDAHGSWYTGRPFALADHLYFSERLCAI